MKDVTNCPRCGAIFMKTVRPICHRCFLEQEKHYEEVSGFLRKRQNRQATIEEIHEQTGVELELIYQFVREGRLMHSKFPNLSYPCDSCGTQIKEGRLCKSCTDSITEGLQKVEEEKKFAERVKQSQREEHQRTITYHSSLNDRLK